MQHTVKRDQDSQDYIKNLELIKVLLKLVAIYHEAEALIPIFEECTLPLLHKCTNTFKDNCKAIFQKSKAIIEAEEVTQKELMALLGEKIKACCMLCSNM
jgi:hypothetical protein